MIGLPISSDILFYIQISPVVFFALSLFVKGK